MELGLIAGTLTGAVLGLFVGMLAVAAKAFISR